MRLTVLVAAVLAALAAHAVRAENVALVIGNSDYAAQPDMPEAARVTEAAVGLTRAGWSVVTLRNLRAQDAEPVLRRLADRLEEADRVLVFLAGRFAHGGGDGWLLAADAARPDAIGVARQGLALSSVLLLAGQKPGGAAVLLGHAPAGLSLGTGLAEGPGGLAAPQGVLLAEGPVVELGALLRDGLLRPETSFSAALTAAGPGVRASGFISDLTGLSGVAPGAGTPPPEAAAEVGYWQAVEDIGTPESYALYLDRYPAGPNAAAARARLAEAAPPATPTPESIEAVLGLDREARRAVQRELSVLGHDPRGIDGIFGRGTRAAIAAWQRANGLAATGFLDAPQRVRLGQQAVTRAAQLEEEARRRRLAAERADRAYWARTGAGGSEAGLRDYLANYPDGLHADEARAALDRIEAEALAAARAEERRAWETARARDTIPAYVAFLNRHPESRFAPFARRRIDELRGVGGPPPGGGGPDEAALQAREDALGLTPMARRLVEARLDALGLEPGVVDGSFDRRTRRAIRRYQRDAGLAVTGYLDRPTVARLLTGGLLPRAE